ncbi:hypothetical protein IV203_036051 [Nitzschia inconspicua]|uniref:Uncharacterized protein n=1 Tax=Nitzschia inconspicua TaxID=303405 RepID=A0A9K3LF45_9STRA|nr:hypothetical protein IV203_036051 [Nitzschia inconspicua]
MKVIAVLFSVMAVATAFAPMTAGRAKTELKKSFFDAVAEMDLFTPVKTQNDYGARKSKNIKTAKLGSNSYVPAGLTAAEYQKIRDAEDAKKAANYEKNVKKAGKFLDFTKFYTQRGTDLNQAWAKQPGRGHTFAKTKYSFDTAKDGKKWDGA